MTKVVGVRFRNAGKIYYFDPLQFNIQKNDHVIVETARGVEYGLVLIEPREVEDDRFCGMRYGNAGFSDDSF